MKMIDVLTKQANKEIEDGTILKVSYYQGLFGKKSVFEFYEDHFFGEEGLEIEELYPLDTDFLNSEVELIPPKEKKYRVRFKLLASSREGSFLSWEKCPYGVFLSIQEVTGDIKTQFTKSELQSIQPVREFLEDMKDKYELIEVADDEID